MSVESDDGSARGAGSATPSLPIDVASLAGDDNLYQAGMTSHASVSVMLALEDRFDIEFPDAMLDS